MSLHRDPHSREKLPLAAQTPRGWPGGAGERLGKSELWGLKVTQGRVHTYTPSFLSFLPGATWISELCFYKTGFPLLFLFWGHIQRYSCANPGTALRNPSWKCLMDHMGCGGSNPGRLCAGHTVCLFLTPCWVGEMVQTQGICHAQHRRSPSTARSDSEQD